MLGKIRKQYLLENFFVKKSEPLRQFSNFQKAFLALRNISYKHDLEGFL